MALPTESRRLRVAWISDYPVEWMEALPDTLKHLRRQHPATWAVVLANELRRRGDIDLHIIVLRNRVNASVSFERNGITYHVLKARSAARLLSLFWLDALLIRRRLRRIGPDVVHAWGTERAAALVASRLGRPYLVTMQGLLTWLGSMAHTLHPVEKFMAALEPPALRRARVVTVESRFGVDYLRERYPSLLLLRAEHAPCNVFFNVTRIPNREPPLLLAVGTASFGKGSDLLLRALEAMLGTRKFELRIVCSGGSEYLDDLRPVVAKELWQRVKLLQDLTPDEVARQLAQATLLVHPSRADNSPNAVKEAVVAGVPVVASDVGGIPDHVTHGKNGLLFRAGDLDALKDALEEALTHPLFGGGSVDPDTWRRARENLSAESMASRFIEAYQTTMRAWGPPT